MEQTAGLGNAPLVQKRMRKGDFKDSSFQTEVGKQGPKVSHHRFRQGAAKEDGHHFRGIPISDRGIAGSDARATIGYVAHLSPKIVGESNPQQRVPHSSTTSSVPMPSSSRPPGTTYMRSPRRETEEAADDSVSRPIPQSQTMTEY